MNAHYTRRGRSLEWLITLLAILAAVIPATRSYACYTWSVGQRVGLRAGGEIRDGSGTGYRIHTRVPEDNWQVDLIGGPRSADGQQWWNVSRKNLDGGGTGWVSLQQAGFDVCSSGSGGQSPSQPPPATQPPSAPSSNVVRLCEHIDQGGTCEDFTGSDGDLRDNRIGNDRASYVSVPAGWRVALYRDINFTGTCQEFTGGSNLPGTSVGNDQVSSLEINAGCRASAPAPQPPTTPQLVLLCEHVNQGGTCENFAGNDGDLRDNRIGNDRASYVKTAPGVRVALFEHVGYSGRCQDFSGEANLPNTGIGNDSASSLKVGESCPATIAPLPVGSICCKEKVKYTYSCNELDVAGTLDSPLVEKIFYYEGWVWKTWSGSAWVPVYGWVYPGGQVGPAEITRQLETTGLGPNRYAGLCPPR